jgi:hypothetical protein
MPRGETIVRALLGSWETTYPSLLAQRRKDTVPPGEEFMHVRLVPYVPYDLVAWAIQGEMDGYSELDNAKVRRQMASGARDCIDHVLAYLRRELPNLPVG